MKVMWWPEGDEQESDQEAWFAYVLMALGVVVFLLALWGAG